MRDLFSTRNQAYWTELIEKEAYSRVHWRNKFAHKYQRVPGPQKPQQPPCPCPAPEPRLLPPISPTRPECPGTSSSPREGGSVQAPQKEDRKGKGEEAKAEAFLPEMRPVTPKTGQLLYQGISGEGQGRRLYLQTRWQQKPEDKFRYPVLSSWDYGWAIGDAMKNAKAPVHARSRLIRDTFYFRNGVFYQPSRSDQRL